MASSHGWIEAFLVVTILHELQALVTAYYGVSDMQVDLDCPMRDLGIDTVGLEDMVAAIETTFNVILSFMVDEDNNAITLEHNLKDQTLRQFSECVNRSLCDRVADV